MGVLGLTPFLHKACPQVITRLPNRLKSLSNKTLVIDATLVTQRFHFSPMPHRYRHVLGWYRLIHELREHSIRAICVFDGEERTVAKSCEQTRRRHIRRTDALRGEIESDRLRRLLALTRSLNALQVLDKDERRLIMASVRNQTTSLDGQLFLVHDTDQLSSTSHPIQSHLSGAEPNLARTEVAWPDGAELDELYREKDMSVGVDIFTPGDIDAISYCYPPTWSIQVTVDMISLTVWPPQTFISLKTTKRVKKGRVLASSLTDLYINYRRGVAQLGVMPTTVIATTPSVFASQELVKSANAQVQLDALSSAIPPLHPVSTGPVDPSDAQVQAAMSKTQYQLTIEEGKLWEKLLDLEEAADHDAWPTAAILASLREKSSFMVQSYIRRNNPPTEVTYEESKNILQAMGVPCIESTGPYEAEALASSLVLNGYADYVASEDTDVLIYGAPLLRNITNRDKSLLLISGSEVRSALRLDARAFVDFALLLGTDFAPRVRNIGPRRALQYIRKHGTIESILAEEKHLPRVPLQTYLQAVRDARDVFVKLPPVPAPHVLEPREYREGAVATILGSHRLQRFLDPDAFLDTLQGNYFNDNPAVAI
ncbi:PIN domain-like protein [Russula earlei]|uniref:PIN domain-like protein n=1 Tax=Russula earlei TaxID=71964 RepID=A0ACC0UBV6_9AGAM|nr:PIN domain-like protein [Russula earlei]